MTRVVSWIVLVLGFCIGLSLSGCTEPLGEPADAAPSLEGRWQVLALQDHHDCPELGSVAPVEPGGLAFQREGAGWRLQPRSGDGVLWTEQTPGLWSRRVATEWEGCLMEASATWRFDGVGDTRFESRFEATLAVSGADCQAPVDSCSAAYTISGARLPDAQ